MQNKDTFSTAFLLRAAKMKNDLESGTLKSYFTTQSYGEQFLAEWLRKKDIYLP
ncbi:hypothetical protein [Tunicatimonas pelagia]|uniref:hypothetical protein n=1 Tax=Tunicatimonas pelagia TaxID=931531 RepID=UPI00266529E9|nr:hypothetical protein [Tunicatimonas pelagia]WKN45422.1 hypothetical protein P0M28_10680 [Tunicatimonas pelagia]